MGNLAATRRTYYEKALRETVVPLTFFDGVDVEGRKIARVKPTLLNNELSDLTVLILSHNRQNCLLPALQYWEKLAVKTLVLDDSPEAIKFKSPLRHAEYLHIQEPFAKRCQIAASLLNTKYSIVVSDDELCLPSGLKRMIGALEENDDFVSVGGVAIAVWEYGPQISATWPYRGTFRYQNLENSPLERIRRHTGDGKKPISAFFTSNMNRTKFLKECLELYAKSPVIATEAISILTVCGAGKSKYLDSLFWIRNWNEFPKSHPNWNRNIYLHDWWENKSGTPEWKKFEHDLRAVYASMSPNDDFNEVWKLILRANEATQPKISSTKYEKGKFTDSYFARYLKYFTKKLIGNLNMPKTLDDVLIEMKSMGVEFDRAEVSSAVSIVRHMRPYKNW